MKTVSIIIIGKVQGVFYRKSTTEQATKLGVTGEVWNEKDGSVKIIATGTADALDALINWCHEGPSRAEVESVSIEDLPLQHFDSFKTLR